MLPAVFNFTKAYRALWAAADALTLGDPLEGIPIQASARLAQLAEAYRLATDANMETIRALAVVRIAEQAGVTERDEDGHIVGFAYDKALRLTVFRSGASPPHDRGGGC